MTFKEINTRAKALRKQKAGMALHAARRAAIASMRGIKEDGNKGKKNRLVILFINKL
jgi:hypothetical protein